MPRYPRPRLINQEELSPVGDRLLRVGDRLEHRARDVKAEVAERGNALERPPVHSIVYARHRYYEHRRNSLPSTMGKVMDRVINHARDIGFQDYPTTSKGRILAAVTIPPELQPHSQKYEAAAAENGVELVHFDPEVSHPAAYNQLVTRRLGNESGMVWMTEGIARMTTDQAFNAAALAVANGAVAVQGTAVASRDTGLVEAAFYNAATLDRRLIGNKPRPAREGMGYLAANRSIVTLDALREQNQQNSDAYLEGIGPFDLDYGNNGYDGELGRQLVLQRANDPEQRGTPAIVMDLAVSVLWGERLSRDQFMTQLRGDWPAAREPNDYIPHAE